MPLKEYNNLENISKIIKKFFNVQICLIMKTNKNFKYDIISPMNSDLKDIKKEHIIFLEKHKDEIFLLNKEQLKTNNLFLKYLSNHLKKPVDFFAAKKIHVNDDEYTIIIADSRNKNFTNSNFNDFNIFCHTISDIFRIEQLNILENYKNHVEKIADLSSIGTFTIYLETGEVKLNNVMYDMFELDHGSYIEINEFNNLYKKNNEKVFLNNLKKAIDNNEIINFELETVNKDFDKKIFKIIANLVYKNGKPNIIYGIQQDLSLLHLLRQQNEKLNGIDILTNLPNRSDLLQKLNTEFKTHNIIRMDLDNFSEINEIYGHNAGDECLKQISERLKKVLSKSSYIARLSGDEFALLIPNQEDIKLHEVAELLKNLIQKPIYWEDKTIICNTTIGIAANKGNNENLNILLQKAGYALTAAKKDHKSGYLFYDESMRIDTEKRYKIIKEIKKSLDDKEMVLFYQPKIDLMDRKIYGFEALIRKKHADGTYCAPGCFLEALENSEVLQKLGYFVIDEAIKQCHIWDEMNLPYGHIAINLTTMELKDTNLVDKIMNKLKYYNVNPNSLQIEVTEGVFLGKELEIIKENFVKLRKNGIKISLDDFGTGFASLTHLREFEIDLIKIDKSFIDKLNDDSGNKDNAVIHAMLSLAKNLNIDVVAEGIETEKQQNLLIRHGCRYGQGYLYSKPLPSDVCEERIFSKFAENNYPNYCTF